MRHVLFALTVGLLPGGASRTQPAAEFRPPDTAQLAAVIETASTLPLSARVATVSAPFLGAPYVLSPLGEGDQGGPDPDPRFRADAFDCTTFVETVIAMTLAENVDDIGPQLDRVRYRSGTADFLNRRHFPDAEWLPELVRDGVLVDITRTVARTETVVEKKRIDSAVWERRKVRILDELPPERIPQGTFSLDVWPLEHARARYKRIPPGTILSLVRADFRTVPVRVSHHGIVVKKNGRLYLRHAADRLYHRVVDEPLGAYLTRVAAYRRWPVTGIHLAQVRRPTPPESLAAEAPVEVSRQAQGTRRE